MSLRATVLVPAGVKLQPSQRARSSLPVARSHGLQLLGMSLGCEVTVRRLTPLMRFHFPTVLLRRPSLLPLLPNRHSQSKLLCRQRTSRPSQPLQSSCRRSQRPLHSQTTLQTRLSPPPPLGATSNPPTILGEVLRPLLPLLRLSHWLLEKDGLMSWSPQPRTRPRLSNPPPKLKPIFLPMISTLPALSKFRRRPLPKILHPLRPPHLTRPSSPSSKELVDLPGSLPSERVPAVLSKKLSSCLVHHRSDRWMFSLAA